MPATPPRGTPASTSFDDRAIDDMSAALGAIEHERGALLAKRTTFGIGGPADLLVIARSEGEVIRALALAEERALPVFVLGGGSNLLVGDGGIRGCVLTLSGVLASLTIARGGDVIDVGTGVTYPRLTRTALDLGWPRAVGWLGTPGQVGGALIMNAGTRHGEIGDVVVEVRAASAAGPLRFDRSACGFAYRKSAFPAGAVLTGTLLQCDSRKTDETAELDAMAKDLLHRRHQSQPKLRSAGSIFKNPPGDFAGRLIEAAGLKGFTSGKAQVSPVHANFVVNLGGARAADVVAVADHARAVVREKFGVELEWEVRRVGVHA
ncbi:MAG TPA: UDP-N-acetylmuramate dehydrogenase [Myxococcota bacterium]|jgi:UDP-N-acetylmuramate dehydrogenase